MKVKRYEGATIKEIIEKIKLDLGPEATILFIKEFSRKRFMRKGIKRLEVIAGVEEQSRSVDSAKLELIHYQIKQLRDSVDNMAQRPVQAVKEKDACLSPRLRRVKERLCSAEVEEDSALEILKEFQQRFTERELMDPVLLEEKLIKHLTHYLETAGPIQAGNNRIVAFIGPTGVGKTTTIAKLAANFSLMERKRVSLITIDTYRIAAVDQLKTYAEIIGIPIEVVFNPQELSASIARNKDKDLIFIDTAGSNPFDAERMTDLKKFFIENPDIETHLLVSMTTKTKELLSIFNCYNRMKVHKVIFTKMDEATSYGNMLNFSLKTKRPVSYVTIGQNVPDDIEIADPEKLARLVVKGKDETVQEKQFQEIKGSG